MERPTGSSENRRGLHRLGWTGETAEGVCVCGGGASACEGPALPLWCFFSSTSSSSCCSARLGPGCSLEPSAGLSPPAQHSPRRRLAALHHSSSLFSLSVSLCLLFHRRPRLSPPFDCSPRRNRCLEVWPGYPQPQSARPTGVNSRPKTEKSNWIRRRPKPDPTRCDPAAAVASEPSDTDGTSRLAVSMEIRCRPLIRLCQLIGVGSDWTAIPLERCRTKCTQFH